MARLLSLNNYHYRRGGADALYFAHEALFQELGWETAVMAMRHPRNEPSPWEEYFVDEIEFGNMHGLQDSLRKAAKVVYSFEARRKLAGLLDRFRPDIVHAHNIYHHISPSVLPLIRERGIPCVMTAHDLKLACPAYKMLNRTGVCERCKSGNLTNVVRYRCVHDSLRASALVMVESYAHKWLGLYRHNLDRIIAPSRFLLEKLVEWGWPREQIVHIPNFVRVEDFEPCFEPGDYFLYFGRLATEKGVETLIRAAAEARVPLRIAGAGPDEQRLRKLADLAGGDVVFHGHCMGETLKALIRGARAVVLPSEWYENAPMSVLEAYAYGKPVIGARIGGIPEMVIADETGWLFGPGRDDELANCLGETWAMPPRQVADMGATARELVDRRYSPQCYRDRILVQYSELADISTDS